MSEILRMICVAAVSMICAIGLSAQYVNAYQQGTIWEYDLYPDSDPLIVYVSRCFFDGEISVGGQSYLKLYEEVTENNSPDSMFKEYLGGIRCEDGRIFYLPPEYNRDFLIFDFNLHEGDIISIYPGIWGYYNEEVPAQRTIQCIKEDVMSLGGMTYPVLEVKEIDAGYKAGINKWIKGIGTNSGLLTNLYTEMGGSGMYLRKVTVNGEVIYETASAGVNEVQDMDKENILKEAFNLDGTMHREGQRGICIGSDGKKEIR